MSFRIQSFG